MDNMNVFLQLMQLDNFFMLDLQLFQINIDTGQPIFIKGIE